MAWIANLGIRTKLTGAALLLALVVVIVGYVGISGVSRVADGSAELYAMQTIGVQKAGDVSEAFWRTRFYILSLAIAEDPGQRTTLHGKINEHIAAMESAKHDYEMTMQEEGEKKLFRDLNDALAVYVPIREEAVSLALDGKGKETLKIIRGVGSQATVNVDKAIQAMVKNKIAKAKEANEANASTEANARNIMLAAIGIAILLAVFQGLSLARMIGGPIRELVAQAEAIAAGDLTVEVTIQSRDEVGQLAAAFKRMVDSLRTMLGDIMSSTEAVASATTQISSSTEEMAAGAQEQSSQAAEVASAVEEMTKTIVENSRNASSTAETAKLARGAAEQGGKVVAETVAGMETIASVVRRSAVTVQELGKSSDQIGEIVGVIDDIADQTNLLALNAAIEAARAGEQGRGFAVVADEVRKLAERTTKATKEIAEMIKKIQADTQGAVQSMREGTTKVDEGIVLADRAGKSLHEIVEISQKVTDMVAQIAAASEEQSAASEQISKNVEGISAVVNQTSTGTQQIAQTTEDLNRLTERLKQLVTRFRIDVAAQAATPSAASGRQKTSQAHRLQSTAAAA